MHTEQAPRFCGLDSIRLTGPSPVFCLIFNDLCRSEATRKVVWTEVPVIVGEKVHLSASSRQMSHNPNYRTSSGGEMEGRANFQQLEKEVEIAVREIFLKYRRLLKSRKASRNLFVFYVMQGARSGCSEEGSCGG